MIFTMLETIVVNDKVFSFPLRLHACRAVMLKNFERFRSQMPDGPNITAARRVHMAQRAMPIGSFWMVQLTLRDVSGMIGGCFLV